MYRIAVCDDEKLFADRLASGIRAMLRQKDMPFVLDVYYSCDSLYNAIVQKDKLYHILFLDILMDGMNGMHFSKRLRERDESASIVFITCTPEYLKQGYTVGAMRYLEKPLNRQELREIIDLDYEKRFRKDYVMVRQKFHIRSIALKELLCLEASGRKLLYHLPGETVEVYAPSQFEEVSRELPGHFVRCHRSFVVNVHAITELVRTEAIVKNGMIVPISRGHYKEVQQAMFAHTGQHRVLAGAGKQ